MPAINEGDRVLYKGSQGATSAKGAIASQWGTVQVIADGYARVRWFDTANGERRVSIEPLFNLVRADDVPPYRAVPAGGLMPQGEHVRVPRPPTHGAPDAR